VTEEFVPSGGAALALEWATRVLDDDAPLSLLWESLDYPLRLSYAQNWVMGHPELAEGGDRDQVAHDLAAIPSPHLAFSELFQALRAHWRNSYGPLGGEPCLVGMSDVVGMDMELTAFTSNEYVGEAPDEFPVHCFITRLVDGEWRIAALSRRLPVPGWPPTEEIVPGLRIDGNP
jgi:hypothetical protein